MQRSVDSSLRLRAGAPPATTSLLQPAAAGRCRRHTLAQQQHHERWIARASSPDGDAAPQEAATGTPKQDASAGLAPDRAFPKTGLFSIADPNAEVYSKAGEVFDPTKKGGRWKPEFIWNTNWQEALKRQEDLERQQAEYRKEQAAGGIKGGTGPGVVSISRLGALEDPSVDLTAELIAARKKREAQQAAAAAAAAARQQSGASSSSSSSAKQTPAAAPMRRAAAAAGASPSYQYKNPPTQSEARRFQRSRRVASAGTVSTISAVGQATPEEAAAKAAAVAAERARYEQLKVEFQGWTLGLGALGCGTCWALYGQDVTISYALGASAGLTYLRLLGRSVDAVGESGGVSGAIGQPRLLIPFVLALTYNRWNVLYAADYGVTLNLYGMLVGFFTYKLAVIGRQGLQLLSDLSSRSGSSSSSSGDAGEGEGASSSSGGGQDDAMSLDRIFVRKVMSE